MADYTREELEKAAEQVFHWVTQLFGYYAWIAKVAPRLPDDVKHESDSLYFHLAQNAVVDGSLINLRRLNEFFSCRPKEENKKHADNLRAYDFEFPEIGRFLDPKDMDELHKRVGHATTRAVENGDASYRVFQGTELALKHSFKFLEHLLREFYAEGTGESGKMAKGITHLISLWTEWCQAAQAAGPQQPNPNTDDEEKASRMPDADEEHEKSLYEGYLAERKQADEFALEIGARYEKLLSLVSGGALAISVTFVKEIAPEPIWWTKWILMFAWLCLAAGLLSTLLAIAASQDAQQRKMTNLDNGIKKRLFPDDEEIQKLDSTSNPYLKPVLRGNKISKRATIGGIGLLILFAFLNLLLAENEESQNGRKTETTTTQIQNTSTQTTKNNGGVLRPVQSSGPTTETKEVTEEEKIMVNDHDDIHEQTEPSLEKKGSYVPTEAVVRPPDPNQSGSSDSSGSNQTESKDDN